MFWRVIQMEGETDKTLLNPNIFFHRVSYLLQRSLSHAYKQNMILQINNLATLWFFVKMLTMQSFREFHRNMLHFKRRMGI